MHTSLLKTSDGHGDFYPTPEWATKAILKYEYLPGKIWEPACGDGSMVRAIESSYPDRIILASDKYDRGYGGTRILDFLDDEQIRRYCFDRYNVDTIITNPPYSHAQEFVEQALRLVKCKVLMLMKLNFMEGVKRHKFFQEHPPSRVYVFSRRIKFPMPNGSGGGVLAYAWYVWDKLILHKGSPTLHWIL